MNKKVGFQDLGLIDYRKCWDYQEALFAKILAVKSANRKENKTDITQNHLLFCEHPHVYTLGKSGDEKNLLVNEDYLKTSEVEVYEGPEFKFFSETQKEHLRNSTFSIDQNNNRMAIQLQEQLQNDLKPIITGPVVPGTVQLTPSGKLIVLMRDCQTTGGYPRILQLSDKGIRTIAQKLTNENINFSFQQSL